MNDNGVCVTRALLSVYDKTRLVEFAKQLKKLGIELISTGGSARQIKDAGLTVVDVEDLTGYPEMMAGRVKTLHPAIHGGLLFRRNDSDDISDANKHGIIPIDLVYINLYPFEETVESGASFEECVENIDIGGPAMLRAAAKNAEFVTVCTEAKDLKKVISELEANDRHISETTRRRLAAKTFAKVASYDAAIANWYEKELGNNSPEIVNFIGVSGRPLRYGENPHQSATFYLTKSDRAGVATAEQIQGKALSYNNINDADAAFELISEFGLEIPTVAIIKHGNPCGVAQGQTLIEAYNRALKCDSTSAFGGIVAVNRELEGDIAKEITKIFTEVVIAPSADTEAKEIFAKRKNLRLLLTEKVPDPLSKEKIIKSVAGGLLVQERDGGHITRDQLSVVSQIAPTEGQFDDLLFAWRVAKHVKSNAIVYAKKLATVGIGAGQMSRIDSSRIAAQKATEMVKNNEITPTIGSVAASDAFFPFPDALQKIVSAGAKAVIQPGGSIRDNEVISAANESGIAMVFTGIRHFRH